MIYSKHNSRFFKGASYDQCRDGEGKSESDSKRFDRVKSGHGELPFDFRESFLLLSKLDVYPDIFAKKIAESVGIRNILVHQYRKLDEKIFYASIKDCLAQYTKYCDYILEFLNRKTTNQ